MRLYMRQSTVGAVVVSASLGWLPGGATAQPAAPRCQPSGQLVRLSDLPEASGVAISRRSPGSVWAHNDSGRATLVGIDARGAVQTRVQLTGIKIDDWEAIAVGTCPGGSCVYIADIGDNDARRKQITLYRIPEPAASESSVAVKEVFHATYPDGAHDAETLLVTPDGGLYLVTKGDTSAVALYKFPRDLRPGASHRLERVGQPRGSGKPSASDRITDGTVSPDGAWVVLRTNDALTFYRASDFLAGKWAEAGRVDLSGLREAQGEGVALADDGTVYLTGEGGGKSAPGTFATMACDAKAVRP
jgi:hypothetical protein